MSTHVMDWVYTHSEARLADRLVLLALADEANDDGTQAYPSQRRIASKARLAVNTARAALERLEASGEIVIHRPARQGRGHFSTYVVLMGRDPADFALTEKGLGSATIRDPKRAGTRGNARAKADTDPLTHRPIGQEPLAPALRALKEPPKERTPDPLFEAVCEVTDTNWREITKTGRGPVNKAVADLRALGVTPGQVAVRARKYAMTYPNAKLTPMALAKHWAELGNGAAPPSTPATTVEQDLAEAARFMEVSR